MTGIRDQMQRDFENSVSQAVRVLKKHADDTRLSDELRDAINIVATAIPRYRKSITEREKRFDGMRREMGQLEDAMRIAQALECALYRQDEIKIADAMAIFKVDEETLRLASRFTSLWFGNDIIQLDY